MLTTFQCRIFYDCYKCFHLLSNSYLLPDKTKHGKQKTTVKRNTCNPKWTDIIKFENVTRDSLLERCLEVTVWDFDSVGSNSLMGGVRLGLGSGQPTKC